MNDKQIKATRNDDGSWSFENIRVGLKNFRGEGGPYNKDGERNFCIFFEGADDLAHELENDKGKHGDPWNIKWSRPNADGQSTAYLQCNIKLGGRFRPPTIWLIPSNDPSNHVAIDETNQSILDSFDWIEIADNRVDVTIRPYDWTWSDGGRHGRKAMVQELYVVNQKTGLQSKWGKPEDGYSEDNGGSTEDVPF